MEGTRSAVPPQPPGVAEPGAVRAQPAVTAWRALVAAAFLTAISSCGGRCESPCEPAFSPPMPSDAQIRTAIRDHVGEEMWRSWEIEGAHPSLSRVAGHWFTRSIPQAFVRDGWRVAVTDCTETPAGATVLAKEEIRWGRSASGRIVHLWVRRMGPVIRPGVVIQLR